jgi:hypothetical protein
MVVFGLLAGVLTLSVPRVAADTSAPLFVNWATLLPSLDDNYDPNSANDCTAGRPHCVDATIEAMADRFDPMARSCDHNAVFAMAYWRTTRTYEWARNQPGFFNDTPFVNHEDAVFAKYYFSARDNWLRGNKSAVPQAWQIAFTAADNRTVTGAGDLMLGMSAHVNRDLPFVLAAIGITYKDGTTRKPDHDKVNQFLNAEVSQLLAELDARFDPNVFPTVSTPYGVGVTGLFQTLEVWREQAWRNAEALTNAPTAADRAVVAQQIEDTAAAEAQAIVASDGYGPGQSTAARDAYCAVNNGAAAPQAYPWGMPGPW